jgi:hypothetical protein
MEDDEPQLAPLLVAVALAAGQQIKLPAFWPEDPASWFRLAEGQFTLRYVTDPITRYYDVLAALSVDSVRLVRHVLHKETGPTSYEQLRTSLLASHSLSNYQKMERMMRLPPLSDRKPLVMLAEMLEFCQAVESSTAIFAFLFLQRLPREIRVLLSEDDPADMRAIADKADRLIAMHVPQSHEACAAVATDSRSEESCVVAWPRQLGAARASVPSRRLWVVVLTSASKARTRGPPCAPPCAITMPSYSGGRGCHQNGDHYAIRPLQIYLNVIRDKECRHDLPEVDGLSAGRPALRFRLFGRHSHRQPGSGLSSATPGGSFHRSTEQWAHRHRRQMPVRLP